MTTSIRDGIPVLRARDGASCAAHVLYLHKRLAANELGGDGAAQRGRAAGYGGVMHTHKGSNMDDAMVWQTMLGVVRGMSAEKAAAVGAAYATPRALAELISSRDAKAAAQVLAGVATGARRLGPVVAKRIVDLFGK